MAADPTADLSADAIVVLGCRVEANGALSRALRRRCEAAAAGFHSGVAEVVIASGGRRWGDRVEALSLRDELVLLGVPREAIWVELGSLTTAENAVYSAWMLRGAIVSRTPRAAIATSGWHLRRALANFERVGVCAFGLAAEDPAPTAFDHVRRLMREAASLRLDMATLSRAGMLGASFLPPNASRVVP